MARILSICPPTFVGRGLSILDAQIEIVYVQVQIGQNELLFDEVPDDSSHLVALHLDYIAAFYFRHASTLHTTPTSQASS